MIECTDWAREILLRSQTAARRFDPDARIRIATVDGRVQAVLTDAEEPGDVPVAIDDITILVEAGLHGLLDCMEPHDQLVLRPEGSPPNPRG